MNNTGKKRFYYKILEKVRKLRHLLKNSYIAFSLTEKRLDEINEKIKSSEVEDFNN